MNSVQSLGIRAQDCDFWSVALQGGRPLEVRALQSVKRALHTYSGALVTSV